MTEFEKNVIDLLERINRNISNIESNTSNNDSELSTISRETYNLDNQMNKIINLLEK